MPDKPLVVVAGAGPAGLTFAYELLLQGKHRVLVLEPEAQVGGLARTVKHKGNRMDIGGHRFFSKSDRVLEWWASMLPFDLSQDVEIGYQNKSRTLKTAGIDIAAPGAEQAFRVRPRLSRIYHDKTFFDYPVSLSLRTIRGLGLTRLLAIIGSYAWGRLTVFRKPRNLEDFFVQRFGRRLYETFFKSYTEKVWGRACVDISAEWGAQRVKSFSIAGAAKQAAGSLVERFLYPHHGPGQLWEAAALRIAAAGGKISLRHKVMDVEYDGKRICSLGIENLDTGERTRQACDLFVSTMPVKDLIGGMHGPVPEAAREVARKLEYRDFITVGVLASRLKRPMSDTWIYIQDPGVKLGRVQIYNNWSAGMIADPAKIWLGLEYFCGEGDAMWAMSDAELTALATEELTRIGFVDPEDVEDAAVLRVPKAYPAYWGAYQDFSVIRDFVDLIPNLYLIGRNGMHRYNNQDHSMLAAMAAVEHILGAGGGRDAIWAVNADEDYHEERS